MRAEWGTDAGAASGEEHEQRLLAGYERMRAELDAFRPDVVLIWGDDQYENYKRDCVPPFCVGIFDTRDVQAVRRRPPAVRDRGERPGTRAPTTSWCCTAIAPRRPDSIARSSRAASSRHTRWRSPTPPASRIRSTTRCCYLDSTAGGTSLSDHPVPRELLRQRPLQRGRSDHRRRRGDECSRRPRRGAASRSAPRRRGSSRRARGASR